MRQRFRAIAAPMLRVGLTGAVVGAMLCAGAARAETVFMSTQLRPVEDAQRARDVLLQGIGTQVLFVPEATPTLTVRVKAEAASGTHTISLIGALHGELQPLEAIGALTPLDDLTQALAARGIPANLLKLAELGTGHAQYIPWMQATYLMAANRQALPYLPAGAKLEHLSYDDLAAWGEAIRTATGRRAIGFPAGPAGLMGRFLEGYLIPSYTGGVVSGFRSEAAAAMWERFARLWKSVNPNSSNYGFMEEPLLSGDVWIAWDHVARLQNAVRTKPDDFVVFPAPAGPAGRSYMPVIAGLAVAKDAPDPAGARLVIEHLMTPQTQILTLRNMTFFPTVDVAMPEDLDPGLQRLATGIAQMEHADDARVTSLPVGLGSSAGEFDKVFLDTFQLIVLRGQPIREVLDREATAMQRVLTATGAPCWAPDPAGSGPCQVK